MKKIIRFWTPVLVWMLVIFLFSSREKVALTDSYTMSFLIFKTLHLIEYTFLYVLCFRAFWNTGVKKSQALLYALILTFLYASTDEIHQAFIPTREGKIRDVIIDVIGGGVGWVMITQFLPKASKKLKTLAKRLQVVS